MVGPINPFAGMGAVNPANERGQLQNERENKQAQTQVESKNGFGTAASEETSDRDADGRQMLQFRQPEEETDESQPEADNASIAKASPGGSIDHHRGNRLDLTG